MAKKGPVGRADRTDSMREAKRHSNADVVLLHGGRDDVPEPSEAWRDDTKEVWFAYWQSDVSRLCGEESLPSLRRLYDLYDERTLTFQAVQKSGVRLIQGSQGQHVQNPLLRYISELDREIRQLEDRFGLTPLSKLQLGVTFGDAARSLEDLNRAFENQQPEEDEPDPRRDAIDV